MKAMILPIVLALVGTGAGVGAAIFLGPSKEPAETHAEADAGHEDAAAEPAKAKADTHSADEPVGEEAYIKMHNQFVVPLVRDDRMTGMVVMSIALQATQADRDTVLRHEPKLRDAFLKVMFNHANMGGFEGNFTESKPMGLLYSALLTKAQEVVGPKVSEVLILELARQDL